ncbi:hypothetical protein [Streptomyces sp. NPDC090025]|uniref:hypothetical protein n=1 Tax=Streptomyces sp. NPDC090025 TaxID=3365922 RepID=UPI00383745E1
MAATDGTPAPDHRVRDAYPPLLETAWRYRVDQVRPEDLPMTAARALADGIDTPALCELAGFSRRADPRDIRDTFERALEELAIVLPDRPTARRYALRRLAARCAAGEVELAEVASDEWSDLVVETAEERAFLELLPPCACCVAYTVGLDEATWAARLRVAARALVARATVGPTF